MIANALFAWFLWNIDEHFCGTLTSWKHALGMPWGIPLELHGWWHILTAISAYTFMAMIEFLTSADIDGSQCRGFVWPANLVLGDLDPTTKDVADANGHGSIGKEQ